MSRDAKRLKTSGAETQAQDFYLRNVELQSKSPGLIYRRSMNWWDRHTKDRFVAWDSLIQGVVKRSPETGDKWIDVDGGFLPVIKWGSRLLFPASGQEEGTLGSEHAGEPDDSFLDRSQQNKVNGELGPMMPPKDAEIFSKLLAAASSFLEFGCGGSTVHALQYPNICQVFSVESDAQWVESLRARPDISQAISCDRLQLVHVDIGPVVRTGWPADESAKDRWPTYSGAASAVGHTSFDFVLVDGRFRTACILKALQLISPENRGKTVLAMHNYYSSGEHEVRYPAIIDFVDVLAEYDYGETIGVFRPKCGIDPAALTKAITKFEYDPK